MIGTVQRNGASFPTKNAVILNVVKDLKAHYNAEQ